MPKTCHSIAQSVYDNCLPYTGSNVAPKFMVGALLLLAGIALAMWLGRRDRHGRELAATDIAHANVRGMFTSQAYEDLSAAPAIGSMALGILAALPLLTGLIAFGITSAWWVGVGIALGVSLMAIGWVLRR